MAYFEGIEMTGGYGNGPDIINSCSVTVNKGEIVSILGPSIETISPLSTFTEQEFIISGPLPYPPVILLPSKNATINYP